MGDLAELSAPPESDVVLVRDPRAEWTLDRILRRTIALRNLQRELRGHDEREEFKGLVTLDSVGRHTREGLNRSVAARLNAEHGIDEDDPIIELKPTYFEVVK
jgi:hypothetical protein